MRNFNDCKKGDIVFVNPLNECLTSWEGTVKSIGPKYITVLKGDNAFRFSNVDGISEGDGSYQLYHSKEDWEAECIRKQKIHFLDRKVRFDNFSDEELDIILDMYEKRTGEKF